MLTKQEATERAKDLKKKMKGRGWKVRVWENIGWHYEVFNAPISVYGTENKSSGHEYYSCLISENPNESGSGSMLWSGVTEFVQDPNTAVANEVARARNAINIIDESVKKAENIIR